VRTASETVPRVSVITAAYNAAPFIEATLRTALDQTLRDIELIVIDDGSKDTTAEVVERIAGEDSRVRLIRQQNRGLAATRNRGVAESRGTLLAFLDHDDLWHPEKLACQAAALDAAPKAAVASCYSALIDEHHLCSGWRYGGDANGDVYEEMLEWDMVSGGSVALLRRAALRETGPFDETLPMRSDWDMWIRLARRYPFVTVPRTLVGYTRTPFSSSRGYERMAGAGRLVLEKAAREDTELRGAKLRFCLARDLFAVASACTIDGEVGLAWHYLARSLAITPAPMLRSPRRWALVAMLALQTVLPRPLYRASLGALNRVSFDLPPGRPFSTLIATADPR
jgi:glycosyltransferase involved in cell wall biosynthesis